MIDRADENEVHALGVEVFLGNRHYVVDGDGNPVLTASRAFFWFLSHLHVEDGEGNPVCSLQRRFGLLKRKFTVEDPSGQLLAQVEGPMFRPNTFMFYRLCK